MLKLIRTYTNFVANLGTYYLRNNLSVGHTIIFTLNVNAVSYFREFTIKLI